MPILIGIVRLLFIWWIASLAGALIHKIAPYAWKAIRGMHMPSPIRKLKLAR